jgi:DNA-directed RNA polymerase III subunit RPC3
MIPSKETKELTYQLLENNFIQLQELRKSMAANAMSKSFYLFYVDMDQVRGKSEVQSCWI